MATFTEIISVVEVLPAALVAVTMNCAGAVKDDGVPEMMPVR